MITVVWILGHLPVHALQGPPLPASFYGVVEGDETFTANATLTAVIHNTPVAQTTLTRHEGQWVYRLHVPGDDANTDIVEGGRPGDVISFHIEGLATGQTAVWQSGVNTQLDLSLSPAAALSAPAAGHLASWLAGGALILVICAGLWRSRWCQAARRLA
ncbi:MAG: hypothetical protein KJ069_29030 [Anaerolineae bacterium]|nr:hypothetical protein [Anaerolineae bacterium]